jgi:hypothetical protein
MLGTAESRHRGTTDEVLEYAGWMLGPLKGESMTNVHVKSRCELFYACLRVWLNSSTPGNVGFTTFVDPDVAVWPIGPLLRGTTNGDPDSKNMKSNSHAIITSKLELCPEVKRGVFHPFTSRPPPNIYRYIYMIRLLSPPQGNAPLNLHEKLCSRHNPIHM